jgi:hypothetical protein
MIYTRIKESTQTQHLNVVRSLLWFCNEQNVLYRNNNKKCTVFKCCVCADWNAIDIKSFYCTIHGYVTYVELQDYVVQVITHFLLSDKV